MKTALIWDIEDNGLYTARLGNTDIYAELFKSESSYIFNSEILPLSDMVLKTSNITEACLMAESILRDKLAEALDSLKIQEYNPTAECCKCNFKTNNMLESRDHERDNPQHICLLK